MWDPFADFQTTVLSNGLHVHAAYWPNRPWEYVGFVVHAGSCYDPVDQEGLGHFVEHLVSENANEPKKNMERFFHSQGGRLHLGTTSYIQTNYGFSVNLLQPIAMQTALSMFGSMLITAQLEQLVDRERAVILNEYHRAFPFQFQYDMHKRRLEALYPNTRLARSVGALGTIRSISEITREQLQAHYDEFYTPANISVIGVGGLSLQSLAELLANSLFGYNKSGARHRLPEWDNIKPPLTTRDVLRISDYMKLTASMSKCYYDSIARIPRHVRAVVVDILEAMLDHQLAEEIREKRAWTYHAGTSWNNLVHCYEFTIKCDAFETAAADRIEEVVEDCIHNLLSSDQLFKDCKRRLIAQMNLIDIAGHKLQINAAEHLGQFQRVITATEAVEDLKAVTPDDVREALQFLSPEQRHSRLVLP